MTDSIQSQGEDRLIELILQAATSKGVRMAEELGRDDAACFDSSEYANGQIVVTTDSMELDSHFRFWSAIKDRPLDWLGRKLFRVNLSDLSSKGAKPLQVILSLGLPNDASVTKVLEFYDGLFAELVHHNVLLVGGDTYLSKSWNLGLTMTGLRTAKTPFPYRKLAKLGDKLYVTGWQGLSDAGFQLLEKNESAEKYPELIQHHLIPPDRNNIGRALNESLSRLAMMDCSDGLAKDIQRMAKSSGAGIRLFADRLLIHPELQQFADDTNQRANVIALRGGEDFELLFATPDHEDAVRQIVSKIDPELSVTHVGDVLENPECSYVLDGREHSINSFKSFEHFKG